MFSYCIRLLTISSFISCLIILRYNLKKNRKHLNVEMIFVVLFILLQIACLLLDYDLKYAIMNLLTSLLIVLITKNLFKAYEMKRVLIVYVFIIMVDILLQIAGVNVDLNIICDLLLSFLIFYELCKFYINRNYQDYKRMNSEINRLKIILKISSDKLETIKYKNNKERENFDINKNILNEILRSLKTEICFFDHSLSDVYIYMGKSEKLYEIKSSEDFFTREFSNNMVLMEHMYNALYENKIQDFNFKDKENDIVYRYRIYPYEIFDEKSGMLITRLDITEEHNLKGKYLRKDNDFKNIVDNMPYDVILEKDKKIIYKNRELKYEDSIMKVILDNNIKGKITYNLDFNEPKILHINKINIEDENATLSILKNITSEKVLLSKMNMVKRKYELFVDIILDAVFILDYDKNKIKYINKSFQKMLQQNNLTLDDIYSIINTSTLNWCNIKTNINFETKKIKNSLDEDVYLEFGNIVSSVNNKNIFIGVFRDITKEVQASILQKKMKEEEYFIKLKNDFFVNLSHELNTPLNLMYTNNQATMHLYQKSSNVSFKNVNFLKQELKSIKILKCLIENLVDIEKLQLDFYTDNKDCFNIVEVIEDTIMQINKAEGINVIFDTSEEEIYTCVDPNNVSRVIAILLSVLDKCSNEGDVINFYVERSGYRINIHIYNSNKALYQNCFSKFEIELINMRIMICRLILNLYNGLLYVDKNYKEIKIEVDITKDLNEDECNEAPVIEEAFVAQEFEKIYNL